MKNLYPITIKLSLSFLILTNTISNTCMITVVNDSQNPILLVDDNEINNKNNSNGPITIYRLPKNSSRRIGKIHVLANFKVFTKGRKGQSYNLSYQVKQKKCGTTGNPTIKVLSLKHNSVDIDLFNVTRVATPQSMVETLPVMKHSESSNTECSSCALMKNKK